MTLRFTPRDRDDLRQIIERIARENPTADTDRPPTLSWNSQRKKCEISQSPRHAISVSHSLFRHFVEDADVSHPTLGATPLG
jgi:hypothetical protein